LVDKPECLKRRFFMKKAWFSALAVGSLLASSVAMADMFQSAVVLEFASDGTGIDNKAYASAMTIIAEAVATGEITEFRQKTWGFEGEVRVCVLGYSSLRSQWLADRLFPLKGHLVGVVGAFDCSKI
jgi:hypothetical protein